MIDTARVFERRYPSLVSALRSQFRDDAEDLAMFAFGQLVRYAGRLDADGPIAGWLYTVAWREGMRLKRRHGCGHAALDGLPDECRPHAINGDPEREYEWRETAEVMARVLTRNQMRAVVARMLGLSLVETSRACNGTDTLTWANRHVYRAQHALRSAMA